MAAMGALSLKMLRQEDEPDGKCRGNSNNGKVFRVKLIIIWEPNMYTYNSRSALTEDSRPFPSVYLKGNFCLKSPGFC